MLNKIWFWLLLIGILYGFGKSAVRNLLDAPAPPAADQQVPIEPNRNREDADPSGGSPMPKTNGAAVAPEQADPVQADPVQAAPDQADQPPDPPTGASPTALPLVDDNRPGVHRALHDNRSFRDTGKAITNAALDAATLSVELCIGLIGVMALWLGMLNIARDAGLVDALAWCMRPIMRWLFPDVPDGHPAQGAMLMNISANMLGLDNAATPFGLKAMRELQTLNPTRETATNAMATFLAINTSNVTIVPISIIGLRVAAGSNNAAAPLFGMLLTTSITTIVAIIAVRTLSRWPRYALNVTENPDLLGSASMGSASMGSASMGSASMGPSSISPGSMGPPASARAADSQLDDSKESTATQVTGHPARSQSEPPEPPEPPTTDH